MIKNLDPSLLERLASLLKSRVPLKEACSIIAKEENNQYFSIVLDSLNKGEPVSEGFLLALGTSGTKANGLYQILKAGEYHARLEEALIEGANWLKSFQKQANLESYPLNKAFFKQLKQNKLFIILSPKACYENINNAFLDNNLSLFLAKTKADLLANVRNYDALLIDNWLIEDQLFLLIQQVLNMRSLIYLLPTNNKQKTKSFLDSKLPNFLDYKVISKMKKLLLLILSLAILGCKQETSLEKTQNTWQKLEKKVLDIRVSATGKVLPWLSIEIKCKASGLIDELPFIESSLVKKGDLLLGLDPIDEERRLKSAEVSLNVAKSRQEQAIINYDLAKEELELRRAEARSNLAYLKSRHKEAKNNYLRINDLIKQNLSSDQDLELATTQKALAESELKKAEIRLKDLDLEEKRIGLKKLELAIASEDVKSKEVALELANQALADTLVYAPMDGVLTSLKVQIGQIIASGISNIGGGTTIMTLANTERLIVRAMVDESDIAKVKLNQKAYFTVDSFLFKRFLGEVIRISAMGETTNNVVLFQVDIEVTDQDKHLLKPEMSAAIDIELDLNDEVLCVPYQAIYEDRGRPWVMAKIKDNSEPQKTFVELGFDDGECFSVISGLNSESQVQITSMQANTFEKQDKHKIRF